MSTFTKYQKSMFVSCDKGNIGELKHSGIIPEGSLEFDVDFCGDPQKFETTRKCADDYDHEILKKSFDELCSG